MQRSRTARTHNAHRRAQNGLTLVELAVTLTIVAVTLGAALPSFTQARERRHLEGAAAQLATDIHHARGLAVARRTAVHLSVQQTTDGSCYVVHTGSAGDCTCSGSGVAQCSGNAQELRTVGFATAGPVRVSLNSRSMLFDPDRGTVTPTGSFNLTSQAGPALRQIVNIMGRARTCSPAGSLPGYPTC